MSIPPGQPHGGHRRHGGNTATLESRLWNCNITDWDGAGTINHSNDYTARPAFMKPDAGACHIGPDSAAIDIGVDAGVVDDIDGQLRPSGPSYDIGADEYWLQVYLLLVLRHTR